MVEFKWIKISLFLIVLLQFRAAVTGQDDYIIVRDGDDATLPCKNVIEGQDKCDSTTWMYSRGQGSPEVELITLGNINVNDKSDRLSVTADCSLVITNVTFRDVGRYVCKQFDTSGQQQGPDSVVYPSVVTIKEQKDADDKVTLTCSIVAYGQYDGSVIWQFEGNMDDFPGMGMSGVVSSSTTKFTASSPTQKSTYAELFKCKATVHNGGTVLFNLAPQSSREKQAAVTGQDDYIIVRDGNDATLPCKNVIEGQDKCDSTTWMYSQREGSPDVELITLGNINDSDKSDRLSVTADCSLVITSVTFNDVGRYVCKQFDTSGQQQGPDSVVYPSVVTIDEQKDADDKVTLTCTMGTYGRMCQGTVWWQFEGNSDDFPDRGGFGVPCRVSATFTASSPAQKSTYAELFKCEATVRTSGTVRCKLAPQSSCEKQDAS